MKRRSPTIALSAILLACLIALVAPDAHALDRTFAGSAQIDYFFVPTARHANARTTTFDGFTLEAAMKVAVDFSERFSANVKVCYACHGFEMDMAHFDYRLAPELNIRFGRFSPSFGSFNLRHDPANHRLADKPLPYDMGRMLRMRAWNEGVLPSPFPDNGVELNGAVSFGESATLDYAAYAVSGFKGNSDALDIDFTQSRAGNFYYVDNNGRPTVGGRMALTLRFSPSSDATLGASAMHGNYDPNNKFAYTIVGSDLSVRIERTNIRLEYLARRTELDTSDPTRLRYAVVDNGDFFVKHGAFAEIEQPITPAIYAIVRGDALYRTGNVGNVPAGAPDGEINHQSAIVRGTIGTAISIDRSLRIKASTAYWQFTDDDAQGKDRAVSFHLGAVGSF